MKDDPGPTPEVPSTEWTEYDQYGHTALWSAYLGLPDQWRVNRFLKRYWIMPVPILAQLVEYELTTNRARSSSSIDSNVRTALLKLILWSLSPYFQTILYRKSAPLRVAFRQAFGFEPATFPPDGPTRPLLPSMPEMHIEGATVTTRAYRRSVHIRMDAVVLKPLHVLREMVYPWNWGWCPFWCELPAPQKVNGPSWSAIGLQAAVRLPGGLRIESEKRKERVVKLDLDVTNSPFAARVDFRGDEDRDENLARLRPGDHPKRRSTVQVMETMSEEDDTCHFDAAAWNRHLAAYELGLFHGYWLIEKNPGRPGTCRVVLEREVRFNDPNHAYFDKQTLWYWAAAELIAFVERAVRLAR